MRKFSFVRARALLMVLQDNRAMAGSARASLGRRSANVCDRPLSALIERRYDERCHCVSFGTLISFGRIKNLASIYSGPRFPQSLFKPTVLPIDDS